MVGQPRTPKPPMTLSSRARSRRRQRRGGWRWWCCCTIMTTTTTTSLFLLLSVLVIMFMIVTNVRFMIHVNMEPVSSVSATSSSAFTSFAAAVSFGSTGGAVTTTTSLDQPQLQLSKHQDQEQQQQRQRRVPDAGGSISDALTSTLLGGAKLNKEEDIEADDDNEVCRNIPSLSSLHELASLAQQQQQGLREQHGSYDSDTYPYQFLIDFAVIGFSKCGTTSMNEWLGGNHPEIVMPPDEDQYVFRKRSLQDVVNNTLYPRYRDYWCMKHTKLQKDLNKKFHKGNKPSPFQLQTNVYESRNKYIQQYYSDKNDNDNDNDDKTIIKPPYFGYKSPNEILDTNNAIDTIQTYFPRLKLIVGIRHPILWFQSFYNFRTVDYWKPLRANIAKFYVGPCIHDEHVCTDHGRYHLYLSKLFHPPTFLRSLAGGGSEEEEGGGGGQQAQEQQRQQQHRRLMNPVFLFEVNQLRPVKNLTVDDDNHGNTSKTTTAEGGDYDNEQARRQQQEYMKQRYQQQRQRQDQFREDLANFIGLQDTKFSEIPHTRPGAITNEKRKRDNEQRLKQYGIDICQPKYDDVRAVLLQHSIDVYNFLYDHIYRSSSQVQVDGDGTGNFTNNQQQQQNQNFHITISSPDYFLELIESYKYDPCLPRTDDQEK